MTGSTRSFFLVYSPHGLWCKPAAPGNNLKQAMKIDITTFKKAAKRYALRHSIPLSQAQEGLSVIFGFNSSHEALKVLSRPDVPPQTATDQAIVMGPLVWSDLDARHLRVLCDCLINPSEHAGPEGASSDRSQISGNLLRAVISDLSEFTKERSEPVTLVQLIGLFDLDAMDERALHLVSQHKGWVHAWPAPCMAFGRYLEALPRYDRSKSGKRSGQVDETRHAHAYAMAGLARVLSLLSAIDAAGGAGNCTMSQMNQTTPADPETKKVQGDLTEPTNIQVALSTLISSRLHPSSELGRAILRAAEVVELYAT